MTNSLPLEVTAEAATLLRAAADWWHRERPSQVHVFAEELEAVFRLLVLHPLAGQPVPDAPRPGVRRLLLRKTQYYLFYRVSADPAAVVVLALWSTRRGSPAPL